MSHTHLHKGLIAGLAVVFISTAAAGTWWYTNQPISDEDPVSSVLGQPIAQDLKSDFLNANGAAITQVPSATWPKWVTTCSADKSVANITNFTPGVITATLNASPLSVSQARAQIITDLTPVFGYAVNNSMINWRWDPTSRSYTFLVNTVDTKNWYCYFTTSASRPKFFSDILKTVALSLNTLTTPVNPTITQAATTVNDELTAALSSAGANLTWTAAPHANQYTISYGTDPKALTTQVVTTNSATVTNLDFGKHYSFTIVAQDSTGLWAASPATSAVTLTPQVIPSNQNVVFATDATATHGTAVTLVSSGNVGNSVWFAPAGTAIFTAGATQTTAAGTATSILAPTTPGTYKLYVTNSAGTSAASTATLTVQ